MCHGAGRSNRWFEIKASSNTVYLMLMGKESEGKEEGVTGPGWFLFGPKAVH